VIDVRRVPDLWRRWDVTVRDLPFALLLTALSFVPAFQGHGTQIGGVPTRPYDLLAVAVVALQCLPLAVRRRWPLVCLVLVLAGFAADQLRGYHALAGMALPIALLSLGAHQERFRRGTLVVLTIAYIPLAVAIDLLSTAERPEDFVTLYVSLALAWGIGSWLRSTRAAEAEHRLRVAADTRAAERTRIARELHDVVTHHVTAMVVQTEAARYLTAAPDRLDATLASVTDTGRRAITDLRHLLDVLNPDHGTDERPAATGGLRTLVEQTRQAGQPVEFTEEGEPAESPGSAERTAYRVVQEALTNALKYAHGGRTRVHVRYGEREITVEVGSDGSGTAARSPGGSGRGLAGLRERVGALGGEFSAGRRADGGFVVRARVPTGNPS